MELLQLTQESNNLDMSLICVRQFPFLMVAESQIKENTQVITLGISLTVFLLGNHFHLLPVGPTIEEPARVDKFLKQINQLEQYI